MSTPSGLKVGLIKPHLEYADELYQLIASSREHLSKFAWAAALDLAGVKQFISSAKGLCLIRINHDKIVGCLEFRDMPNEYTQQVGYWIGKDYAGQGIMKQALSLGVCSGFIDQRLFACIKEDNKASAAVLHSNGFVEGEHVDGWVTYRRIVGRPRIDPWLIVG